MKFISLFIKWSFSSLFLIREHFVVCMHSLTNEISTVMRAWSNISLWSRWIQWLLCSDELGHRNTRFKTKFESWTLLGYLVEKNLVGLESFNQKESVILKRVPLWEEWYRKLGSQKLFLMLNLPSWWEHCWD